MALIDDNQPIPVRRQWAGFLPALAVMALIFVLSHQERPPTVGSNPELGAIAGHLVAYALLAAALLAGCLSAGMRFAHAAVAAVAISLAFGITDELHQRYVPGRHADPWDVLTDLIGAMLAVGLITFWWDRRRKSLHNGPR